MKTVSILGATGSIGSQALDVCQRQGYSICALTANSDAQGMALAIERFHPSFVALANEKATEELRKITDPSVTVEGGKEGLIKAAKIKADIVLNATTGIAGLAPSIATINAGNTLALANKETLVAGGKNVIRLAKEKNVKIIPVDSEHSAIFQCLQGQEDIKKIKKLILTASGGPFFGRSKEELSFVKAKDALCHPTWNMGKKVTIDSASMVNKGLEIIEAALLFDIDVDDIEVLVHRQSIVHSMVEFIDNSVLAQLGVPDMRTPIQYAFSWPDRLTASAESLSLSDQATLSFAKPDEEAFPAMRVAREAYKAGGTVPTAFNAADEVAVEAFLKGEIAFTDITKIISDSLKVGIAGDNYSFNDVYETDKAARDYALKHIVRR